MTTKLDPGDMWPGRGRDSVRIAYQGPQGTEVRRWVLSGALCQVTLRQALHG